jgi:autotransporter-associated beta strand protein
MTAFAGTIEMGTSTGTLRINGGTTNTNFGDSLGLFDLGTSTATLSNRNGAITINLGAVQGGPRTTFFGRSSGGGTTTSTYVVGALNTNNTFAGSFSNGDDQLGIVIDKVGTGNWTLSGTSSFLGTFLVENGTLTVSGSMTLSGSDNNNAVNLETQNGANFVLAGGTVTSTTVEIDNGATFTGNGAVNGKLINNGVATVNGGGPLIVNGNFQNNGTMTIDGGSTLQVTPAGGGSGFVNNGLLDIMDSPQTALPAGYVNNGTILDSSLVTLQGFNKTGTTFSATIQTYAGHTYQLQESSDLVTWTNVGAAQAGTGSPIVLTDTNAVAGSMIYQIGVGP